MFEYPFMYHHISLYHWLLPCDRLRTHSLKTIRRQFESSPPSKTVHMIFGPGDRVLYSGDDNF